VGHAVTASDYSEEALGICAERAASEGLQVTTVLLNVYDIPTLRVFCNYHRHEFDCVYARFFIHAIQRIGEDAFLEAAATVVKPGGRVFVEFRTVGDPQSARGAVIGRNERVCGHYRRFIEPQEFMENARAKGLHTEYCVVGRGMAKLGDDDPEVCRVVLGLPEKAS
jgi:2-polyprenyl-3-methyl-5-hydroxy-6-metoxy-1,4-benzoquinol methylase